MLTFDKLWKNYPTITGDDNPCQTNSKLNFTDQYAIRMGVCLARCGVDTSRIPGAAHCWYGRSKSQGHVIRAEELTTGLEKHSVFLSASGKYRESILKNSRTHSSGREGL